MHQKVEEGGKTRFFKKCGGPGPPSSNAYALVVLPTIQLGVQKAMDLPEMSKAIGRAKRSVCHFYHSCKSSNVLRSKQQDLKQCLIQSVPTRWNSTYYMIERILK